MWLCAGGQQWSYPTWPEGSEWVQSALTILLQSHSTKKSLNLPFLQKLPPYRTESFVRMMYKDERNCCLLILPEMTLVLKYLDQGKDFEISCSNASAEENLLRLFFIIPLFPQKPNLLPLHSRGRGSTALYSTHSVPSTSKAGEFSACLLHISQHLFRSHKNLPLLSSFLSVLLGSFALVFIIPSPSLWRSPFCVSSDKPAPATEELRINCIAKRLLQSTAA